MSPNTKQVTGAFDTFLDQGVVGAVALLTMTALIWVTKALLKAKDDRISDQKLYAAALQKTNEGVQKLAIEVNKAAGDMSAQVTKNGDAVRSSLTALEKSTEDLETTVGSLKDKHVELVAGLRGRS